MRHKLVILLSLTTVAFAATSAWLAHELANARRQLTTLEQSAVASAAPSVTASTAAMRPAPGPQDAPAGEGPPPAVSTSTTPDQRSQIRAALDAELPRLRAILENPDRRAAYLREVSASHHRAFPRLAGTLGLTGAESDRLADLLAEQQLRYLEVRYRCALNPQCDQFGFGSGYRQAADQELIDLLGPEGKSRFDEYRDNIQERRHVTGMRGEMPDSLRISDDQAEKLTAVLGEVRRRAMSGWQQNNTPMSGLTTEYGSIHFPESPVDLEQRMAYASDYLEKQRKEAAGVLNPGQLEYFSKRQQLFLEQIREHLGQEAASTAGP